VLGATGRGLPEQLEVPRSEIDITIGSLASAWSSSGGFCAGDSAMVEHQRITSLAYTFSATMPAYLAKTTTNVSRLFDTAAWREKHFTSLRQKVRVAYDILNACKDVNLLSEPVSPHIIFELADESLKTKSLDEQHGLLLAICDGALARNVLLSPVPRLQEHELHPIEHRLKLIVNDGLSIADVTNGTHSVIAAIHDVL
jgi:serine palmitoyltransferase